MSLYDYEQSKDIDAGKAVGDPSFVALIMAAMRKADTGNYHALCATFPDIAKELRQRYNAPRGLLDGESVKLSRQPFEQEAGTMRRDGQEIVVKTSYSGTESRYPLNIMTADVDTDPTPALNEEDDTHGQ